MTNVRYGRMDVRKEEGVQRKMKLGKERGETENRENREAAG